MVCCSRVIFFRLLVEGMLCSWGCRLRILLGTLSARLLRRAFMLGTVLVSTFAIIYQLRLICVGNFTGPLVYKTKDAPRYVPGFITVVVTSFAAGVIVLIYRFICLWENRRRDESGTSEAYENAYQDDLTDKTVSQTLFLQGSLSSYSKFADDNRIHNSDIFCSQRALSRFVHVLQNLEYSCVPYRLFVAPKPMLWMSYSVESFQHLT